jgi:primase-polymerase (primpol)-like protein
MEVLEMQTIFPQAFAALPQWVCWRLEPGDKGRDTKIPYNPRAGNKASPTSPDTWTSLENAQTALRQHSYTGLGFREAGIVGVDIDHCIDPATGALNETAAAILEKLAPTYTEVSPSGTGLHIFLRGAMPVGGSKNCKSGVEMYAHSRYFTMTGTRYGDCPVVVGW